MSSVAIQQGKETGRTLITSAEEAPADAYAREVTKNFVILDSQIEGYNFIEILISVLNNCYHGLYSKDLFKEVINDTTNDYYFILHSEGGQRGVWSHPKNLANKNLISMIGRESTAIGTSNKVKFYIYGIK